MYAATTKDEGNTADGRFSIAWRDSTPYFREYMIRIKEADQGLSSTLSDLIRKSFKDVALKFSLNRENCPTHPSNCTADWIRNDFRKGKRYFILLKDNFPCGCIGLEKGKDEVCYLGRLSVLPDYRRDGLGKRLVDHFEETAREEGYQRIEIGVIKDHDELVNWYKRIGFKEKECKKFDHLPFEVLFMYKTIGQ
jgi:ribosomal protein S18 acetylase RimI-like enzyme